MDFDQVLELARCIGERREFQIVAIGRFVPLVSIDANTPWAISIAKPGDDKPTVVRSGKQYAEMLQSELKRLESLQQKKSEPVQLSQPTLF